MANNTTLPAGAGGDVIADEDIAGVKYQQVKLIDPTVGSTTPIGTAANPIRVNDGLVQAVTDAQLRATPVPVSGTVSANAGTNLNTSLLALDATLTGGTQKAIVRSAAKGTAVAADVTSNPVDANTQALHVNLAGTNAVNATLSAETTKVIGTVNISAAQAVTANAGTNLNTSLLALDSTLTGGTQKAIARGAAKGVTAAGDATTTAASADRQPLDVTIYTAAGVAKDPTQIRALTVADVVGLGAGAAVIGSLAANQSVNVAQIAAAATVTAAAGVQKVGVVGNAGAIFDAATAAAVPANALYAGARAATANPTNAIGGNMVGVMADKAGRLVTTHGHVRELVGVQQANVAVNTEATVITAGGAGVFNDLAQLIITTAGLAAQTITIKDATAGTTRMILNYPNAAVAPGAPLVINFNPPIPQATANANWTVTQSLATACNYTAVFVKNT